MRGERQTFRGLQGKEEIGRQREKERQERKRDCEEDKKGDFRMKRKGGRGGKREIHGKP